MCINDVKYTYMDIYGTKLWILNTIMIYGIKINFDVKDFTNQIIEFMLLFI